MGRRSRPTSPTPVGKHSGPVDEPTVSASRRVQPPWLPDSQASACMACGATFSFFLRKHHCRACGKIFCYQCADRQLPLPDMGYGVPVRVCHACDERVTLRRVFEDNHAKLLTTGALFAKHGRNKGTHRTKQRWVALSADYGVLSWHSTKKDRPMRGSLPVTEIVQVHEGQVGDAFRRDGVSADVEGRAFSVQTTTRSLDLEAPNEATRDDWVAALRALVAIIPQLDAPTARGSTSCLSDSDSGSDSDSESPSKATSPPPHGASGTGTMRSKSKRFGSRRIRGLFSGGE